MHRNHENQAAVSSSGPDPLLSVDPELRNTLQEILRMGGPPEANTSTLPMLREMMSLGVQPPLAYPPVEEIRISSGSSAPSIDIYIVGNEVGARKPAVLHLHHGGYIAGSAAFARRSLQEVVLNHHCVAVSVEYRLAPETKSPGPLEDAYAALLWLHTNAEELGIDPTRIAIKGESAGGGLAAALAIMARDRQEVRVCAQILLYPMLDDRTGSSFTPPPQFGQFFWNTASNRFAWSCLLGKAAGSAVQFPNMIPAREVQLEGLAPTFLGVGALDLFALEGIDYARRLLSAGVSTELVVVPGAFHLFDACVPTSELAISFHRQWNQALTRAFAL